MKRTIVKRGPQPGATNAGRPRGSGGTTVRVVPPRWTELSYRLFIGRALWQRIGEPDYIVFDVRPRNLIIHPSSAEWKDSYRVVGSSGDSVPRISIGETALSAYGLVAGEYYATVYSDFEIRISNAEIRRVLYEVP